MMSLLLNPKITGGILIGVYFLIAIGQWHHGNWRMAVYWVFAAGITYVLIY